jgi:hypothetical protein
MQSLPRPPKIKRRVATASGCACCTLQNWQREYSTISACFANSDLLHLDVLLLEPSAASISPDELTYYDQPEELAGRR